MLATLAQTFTSIAASMFSNEKFYKQTSYIYKHAAFSN